MKWCIGLILVLCVVFGASVSQGEWMMRIHEGATVEERALADIDSLTFYDPTGSCCAPDSTCTVATQSACSGVWVLHGVCTPNPCGALPGEVGIPAGTFTMGSPTDEPGRSSDETQHQVTLTRAIYVSKHEVTQSEWQAAMGWNDSYFPGADRPVERVTWFDAVSYCNQRSIAAAMTPAYTITGATYNGNHITNATVTWNQTAKGYRLLTEAEWEYVCRATSMSAFCNGGITTPFSCSPLDPNLNQVGWYCGNASSTTHDVGGKAANAWGLKDMHGNVWEWCWDYYGAYPAGPVTDPTGPASGNRIVRGGSWVMNPKDCRSARRAIGPAAGDYHTGFHLSRTAP
jgi:formylglycine-generating enzyme required for sulfatase activity